MKKLLLLAIAGMFAITTNVFAQTPEEASQARITQLTEMVTPKACGEAKIDALCKKAESVNKETVAIAAAMDKMNEEGPLLEVVLELQKRVKKHSDDLAAAVALVPDATAQLKAVKNPMKLKPVSASMGYANKVLEISGTETTYQLETILNKVASF